MSICLICRENVDCIIFKECCQQLACQKCLEACLKYSMKCPHCRRCFSFEFLANSLPNKVLSTCPMCFTSCLFSKNEGNIQCTSCGFTFCMNCEFSVWKCKECQEEWINWIIAFVLLIISCIFLNSILQIIVILLFLIILFLSIQKVRIVIMCFVNAVDMISEEMEDMRWW